MSTESPTYSQAALQLSAKMIKAKRNLRRMSQELADLTAALEATGDCPIIQECGIYHIDMGETRIAFSQARSNVEAANARLCEEHIRFNETIKEKNVPFPPESEVIALGGGGR